MYTSDYKIFVNSCRPDSSIALPSDSRRSVNRSLSLHTSSSESLDSGCPDPPARNGNMGWPILAMREMSFALAVSGFCKTQKKQKMVNEQYL